MLPLRALDNCGDGNLAWILEAFDYAGEQGIPIVTASFGTDPWLDRGRPGRHQRRRSRHVLADHPDTLYVVAAGNEGNDNDELPVYPCNTLDGARTENLVCVGMSDRRDSPVCSGNVGAGSVDVFAPGVGIYSTVAAPSAYVAAERHVDGDADGRRRRGAREVAGSELRPRSSRTSSTQRRRRAGDPIEYMPVSAGRLNAGRAVGYRGELGDGGGPSARVEDLRRAITTACATSPTSAPTSPGTLHGCPDADGDGRARPRGQLPGRRANADQADADGDGVGDACDPTPRGEDVDGDTKAALDDRCPDRPGSPPTAARPICSRRLAGRPPRAAPPAGPDADPDAAHRRRPRAIVSLGVRVTPQQVPARHRVQEGREGDGQALAHGEGRAQGRAAGRSAGAAGSGSASPRSSLTATASGRSLTIRGKRGRSLARGPYRVTATLAGAAKTKTRSFTRVSAAEPCRLGVLALGDSITNGGGELQWGVALQSWALWVARGLGLPFTTYAVDGARAADVADEQVPAFARPHARARTRATTSAACTSASTTCARRTGTRGAFAADHAIALAALAERCDRLLRGHDPARPRPPARRRPRSSRPTRSSRPRRARTARSCSTCAASARATW